MLNLIWLQTYVTLVETGHFTRTADKLAMTQPGVSQHVRKLEDHFGQPLLQREGKRFQLTQAGREVYRQAQRTLADLSLLEQQLATDNPFAGAIRFASPGSLGLKLYPELLALQQAHPELTLDYTFAPNEGVERELLSRNLDLGLITRMGNEPELAYRPFGEEPLYLVTPGSVQTPCWDSLMRLGYQAHPDGEHHISLLLGANFSEFQQLTQLPRRGFCNHIGMLLVPVARGLCFTVLPKYAVEAFGEPDRVAVHSLANPVSEPIYLVYRRHQPHPTRVRHVIDTIKPLLNPQLV
ncbi:LysR family transcriptional regulator [Ferrimonas sediminicola]|uniref:LysR family transcriptional regulator n=1 Tax=Ferrimonas sediminicola TaxID=2569538 RepID=A0A4V5NXA2_9GAMM|nr:LysR family transcriptional regulator [Ferrimonas sediminicola]TKB50253.1 LysR family transcriptional regulator [Ferrimonas sediminicola]